MIGPNFISLVAFAGTHHDMLLNGAVEFAVTEIESVKANPAFAGDDESAATIALKNAREKLAESRRALKRA